VSKGLGGVGIADYISNPGSIVEGAYTMSGQVWTQTKAVLLTLVWSGVGSAILYKVVDVVIGLRVPVEQEREGLDIASHGERAYNY
jgi:Amt family ammonium transporter